MFGKSQVPKPVEKGVVKVQADTDLADGVYSGTAVTEDLQPISLLLQ